jgi:AraC family transcriptional regulator
MEVLRLCCYCFPVMQNAMIMPASAVKLWTVEAAADVTGARVELRRYELPCPNEMWEMDDAPIFSSVLPRPEGIKGQVRFKGGDPRSHQVGKLVLRPGGIPMYSTGNGGLMNILTCRFDPDLFARVTGLSDWDAVRLRRCAAIESRPLSQIAARLYSELAVPGLASSYAVDALTRLLLVEIARLFRSRKEKVRATSRLAPWQLARIEDCLRAATGHWPTTTELAQSFGISRSHLSRAFAATSGTTLAEYAATLRIERAKALMRSGDRSMQQIAEQLGFATASAFSVAFRRATGGSPSRFECMMHGQRTAP